MEKFGIDLSGYKAVHIGHAVAQDPQGLAFMHECHANGIQVFVLPPGGQIPEEGIKAWQPSDDE